MDAMWLSASGYEMAARIGNGAFSSVYRAKRKESAVSGAKDGGVAQYVAIKIMDLEHISSSFEDILQEVQTMKMCDDPNILRCHCSFVHADQLWLVTELMDKGSCLRVMNVSRSLGMGDGMNEEWLAYILREALQGLHYLHNNGQIHRDIKSGNILLDGAGSVRLADFGVSGWTVNSGQRLKTVKTFVGTPVYMAPEVGCAAVPAMFFCSLRPMMLNRNNCSLNSCASKGDGTSGRVRFPRRHLVAGHDGLGAGQRRRPVRPVQRHEGACCYLSPLSLLDILLSRHIAHLLLPCFRHVLHVGAGSDD